MSAVDRFIDGEDRLSALLKALPAYAPPKSLQASVQAAARAAQEEAGRRRAGTAALPFSAPPALAAAVLEEAARVQAAQAMRRDALLGRVAAGEPAADVLGAPVSPVTRDWLTAEAQANASAQKAARERNSRTVRARQWWRSLGLVASVAAVAGLTTSIVLRQIDDGALQPATTREMSAPAPAAADIAAVPAPEAAPESAASAIPAPPAAKPAPQPRREERRAAASEDKRSREPAERSAPRESARDSARDSGPPGQASEGLSANAPAITAAPPAMPMTQPPAYSAMAEAAPPAAAPAPPPSPAAAPQANFARKAAPPLAAARTPVSAAASAAQAMTVSVRDDPATTAARLDTLTPLRLWAAEPDNAEIREWAGRLWQSMPAGQRPPVPFAVQADRTLAPGQVRIELPQRAPQ